MNRNAKRLFVVFLTIMLVLAATATVAAESHHTLSNIRARLSGRQEVPPVRTPADGTAYFSFNDDLTAAKFRLVVSDIQDVVAAHIHCAPAGVNGPVGVTLFSGGPTSPNGLLASGMITEPDDDNDCGWQTMRDVARTIRDGNAYVNVHTLAHPSGEIRGQLP